MTNVPDISLWREVRPYWPLVLFFLACGFIGFALSYVVFPSSGVSVKGAMVIKVCRDGTLILKSADGAYAIVRRDAQVGWPALGPNVCE
jgi:hypothetical protein